MIVTVRIPIKRLGLPSDREVIDPSVGPVGEFTHLDWDGSSVVATLELDDAKLRSRLAEKRHAF